MIFWILLLGAVVPAAFYIWYLTWPVRTGTQQSLFLAHGFSPKKRAGQVIDVAVCPVALHIACPWRPWFELCTVLVWSGFVLSAALIAFLQHALVS